MDPDFYRYFKRYKTGLFINLIKDDDFKLLIFHNNNEIRIRKSKSGNVSQNEPIFITKEKLDDYILEISKLKKDQHYNTPNTINFFKENLIITHADLEYIKLKASSLINISQAQGILWSDDLIERYIDDWSWDKLSANPSITWDSERIRRFEKHIDFQLLSSNTGLYISQVDLEKYSERWDWDQLSANSSLSHLSGSILKHPSGELLDISLLDHLMITAEEYFSFADEGLI